MRRPAGFSTTRVQTTVAAAGPGFIVKTRQQPFDAWVATKNRVTPAGSELGSGGGWDTVGVEVEVHVRSESDITSHDTAERRIPSMQRA
jgi:hypothetical protein